MYRTNLPRLLLTLTVGLLTSFGASSQYTLIPDSAFEAQLIAQGIDSEAMHDGQVLTSDAQAVTELNVASAGISDMTGIEAFTALTELWAIYNEISILNVSTLGQLRDLVLTSNQIASLDISQNPLLEKLYLPGNPISGIDLSNNPEIGDLLLSSTGITSVDISQLTKLWRFRASNLPLGTIDLSNNPDLRFLELYNCNLSGIDLSTHTQLININLSGNALSSIALDSAQILYYMDVSNNLLTSLDLSANPAITDLFCGANQITSLDLSHLHDLFRVNCSDNGLTSLNVKNGNNENIDFLITILNEDLLCIEVDDPVYSDTTWTVIDDWTFYSEDCSNAVDCSVFDTAPVDLTKSFDPVDGVEDRVQVKWFKASPQVRYSDEDAAMCDIKFWPKRDLDPVTGNPVGPAYVAPDTIFINDKVKTYPDGAPREFFKWPVKYRADGANNAKRAEPNIRYEWQVRCECGHDGTGQESPWSEIKIFNTPDFNPTTGINTKAQSPLAQLAKVSGSNSSFDLFPNPNQGEGVYLEILGVDLDGPISVRIFDLAGRLNFERKLNKAVQGRVYIDFAPGLEKGVYLVQVTLPKKRYSEQLLIE